MKTRKARTRTSLSSMLFPLMACAFLLLPAIATNPVLEAAVAAVTDGGDGGGNHAQAVNPARKRNLSEDIDTLVSMLPLLPPDKASRPFDTTLKISGLPVGKFLSLLSRKPFLDLNLVIATNSPALDQPFDVALSDITVGELFNLILQLNGLKALRFNEKTLIIVSADDKKSFGIRRRKTYQLRYFLPSKLLDFINDNDFLKQYFEQTSMIANDVQRNLLAIGTPDELTLMSYLIDLLDKKPHKIHARIPISNIEFDDLKAKLTSMLPEDIAATIDTDRWVYSEAGRAVLVYDDPETVKLLKKLIANIDIPKKQVLIDIALMEVTRNFSRTIGMNLNSSSFSVDSLDKLFSLSRLSNQLSGSNPTETTVSYLIQKSGGRALASPKVRVLDGETADINIGEIRNVRIQSTEFSTSTGGASQQTTYNTQEIPIGVQLNVKPTIHNDGTVTLELTISDEAVLAIQEYGVDRTTRNSSTKLRIKDGETVIMGGFISQNRDWDKTPIPILGQLPLIGRLFRAGKRTKIDTELVFLITPYILDYEKERKVGFRKKTLADIHRDYTRDLSEAQVRSSTTKWLEDETTRTKVILDADGRVVYRQSWSKATGKPIGETIDLRSDASGASGASGTTGKAPARPDGTADTGSGRAYYGETAAVAGPATVAGAQARTGGEAALAGTGSVPAGTKQVIDTETTNRRMTADEFRRLMAQPLEPPSSGTAMPSGGSAGTYLSAGNGQGEVYPGAGANYPTAPYAGSATAATPAGTAGPSAGTMADTAASPTENGGATATDAERPEQWDGLLDRLDSILKKG